MSEHEPADQAATTDHHRRHRQRGPVLSLKFGGVEVTIRGWRGLTTLAVMIVVGAAVAQELRLPAARRTWHGYIFRSIPYDFRIPTLGRLRKSFWDPANPSLFTDKSLGVGWDVNLARLFAAVKRSSFVGN